MGEKEEGEKILENIKLNYKIIYNKICSVYLGNFYFGNEKFLYNTDVEKEINEREINRNLGNNLILYEKYFNNEGKLKYKNDYLIIKISKNLIFEFEEKINFPLIMKFQNLIKILSSENLSNKENYEKFFENCKKEFNLIKDNEKINKIVKKYFDIIDLLSENNYEKKFELFEMIFKKDSFQNNFSKFILDNYNIEIEKKIPNPFIKDFSDKLFESLNEEIKKKKNEIVTSSNNNNENNNEKDIKNNLKDEETIPKEKLEKYFEYFNKEIQYLNLQLEHEKCLREMSELKLKEDFSHLLNQQYLVYNEEIKNLKEEAYKKINYLHKNIFRIKTRDFVKFFMEYIYQLSNHTFINEYEKNNQIKIGEIDYNSYLVNGILYSLEKEQIKDLMDKKFNFSYFLQNCVDYIIKFNYEDNKSILEEQSIKNLLLLLMEPSNKEQIDNIIIFFLIGKKQKNYFDLNKLHHDFQNEKSNYFTKINSNQNLSFIKLKFEEFIKDN